MKKMLRRIIRRKVLAYAFLFGIDKAEQCVEFITDAPIWQWHKRLWLVKTTIGSCSISELEDWLVFLDK